MSEQKVERRHYGPDRRKPDPAAAREHPTVQVPRLVTTHHVKHLVHGAGSIGHFNNRLAVVITKSVGTMWAAYLFTLIAIVGAVALITSNAFLTLLVALVSQTFLQLVLLPVIIVGQNVISASQDARAEADHETLTALHAMNVRQLQILEQQDRILHLLEKRAPAGD